MPDSGAPSGAGKVCLRPYQQDVVERVRGEIRAGRRRVLLVAPTGSGKCVTPDTWVWSRGLRRFGDVWGSDRIAGPRGIAEVTGWYDDGEREGRKVTLECGLSIDATLSHRVWVRTCHGGEGWKHVGDLTCDDFVAVARGEADFGTRSIDPDEAYTMGLLVADGAIRPERLQIDKQRPVLERVRPVIDRWLRMAGGRGGGSRISDLSPYHAVLQCNGSFLALLRDRLQVEWAYCEKREVPQCILEATRDGVRAFLRGYFDGDGYCDRAPGVSSACAPLIDQVHQLLLGLGVYTARRTRTIKNGLPAHTLTVRDPEAFAREVGFTPYGLIKDRSFADLLERRRNTNLDTVPGVGALLRLASRHVAPKTPARRVWRFAEAYFSNEKFPSYHTVRELAAALPPCPERDELMRIVVERRAWSRVESVTSSSARRIDCEVADQHAFVGNGIVNHNTVIAAHIIASAVASGSRVLFMAHRRELIGQAYRRLVELGLPEAEIGVLMARDARRRPAAAVQVACIDTLRNRAKPPADLVFVDEAHRALAGSYRDVAAIYPDAVHLGLTATPYRADGRGLGEAYDALVVVASIRELIAEGFLVEPRVFTVPHAALPDLGGVRVRGGDYDETALAAAVDRRALVGNIVEHWLALARGIRTVAFAVSVEHSKHIAERFREAGVPAEHLDGTTPVAEREAILARLGSGETLVVSNCAVLCEGWDQPAVKCAILARPTKSTGLYLQQAGRILRPFDGSRAIILDHGGCAHEHGLPQEDRVFSLAGEERGKKTGEAPVRTCPECHAVLPLASRECPECGAPLRDDRGVPEEVSGALVEVHPETLGRERVEWDRLCAIAAARGYKPGWPFYRFKEKFGKPPPESFPRPGARRPPESAAEKRAFFDTLRAGETSGAWARLRYRIEIGEPAPDAWR